jgi:hypothetical protein
MPDNLKGHWSKAAIGGLVLVNAVLMTLLAIDERSRELAAQPALSGEPSATGASPAATRSTPAVARPAATPGDQLPTQTATGSPSETASPSADASSSPSSTE